MKPIMKEDIYIYIYKLQLVYDQNGILYYL